MKKHYAIVLVLLIASYRISYAQTSPSDHFRSKKSGTWNIANTWESSADSIDWITATSVPLSGSASITICDGQTVTINSSVTMNGLKIMPNGTLKISNLSTGNKVTIKEDIGPEVQVYGTFIIEDTLLCMPNTSVIVREGGVVSYSLGSRIRYVHPFEWEPESTLQVCVYGNIPISGLIGPFSNLWFNLTPPFNQIIDFKINFADNVYINGDLKIQNHEPLKTGTCYLNNNKNSNIYISGDMIIDTSLVIRSAYNYNTEVNVYILGDLFINKFSTFIGNRDGALNLWGNFYDYGYGINSVAGQGMGVLTFNNNLEIQHFETKMKNYITMCINEGVNVTMISTFVFNPKQIIISPNGSLITDNKINSLIKLEVPNADWDQAMSGWKMISCPTINQTVDIGGFTYPIGDQLYDKYDFYEWNESQALWINQKLPENGITNFTAGRGYLCSYDEGGIKEFSGLLNNTSVVFSDLCYTENRNFSGYHLLGNPFCCALDWNNPAWNRQNVCEVAQLWNSEAENYIAITDYNNLIPSLSGFFVQVLNNQNSINIPKEARVHYNEAQKRKTVSNNYLVLKIHGENETVWDQTTVRLNEEALTSYDRYDGWKLDGSNQSPSLYTIIDSKPACVNSLPINGIPESIPLCLSVPHENEYVIEVDVNSIKQSAYLFDKITGVSTVLKNETTYAFQARPDDLKERFAIKFGPLGVESNEIPAFEVFMHNSKLYIVRSEVDANQLTNYQLFNLAGKLVMTGSIDNNSANEISLSDLPHGAYVVRVFSNHNHVVVKKLIL